MILDSPCSTGRSASSTGLSLLLLTSTVILATYLLLAVVGSGSPRHECHPQTALPSGRRSDRSYSSSSQTIPLLSQSSRALRQIEFLVGLRSRRSRSACCSARSASSLSPRGHQGVAEDDGTDEEEYSRGDGRDQDAVLVRIAQRGLGCLGWTKLIGSRGRAWACSRPTAPAKAPRFGGQFRPLERRRTDRDVDRNGQLVVQALPQQPPRPSATYRARTGCCAACPA